MGTGSPRKPAQACAAASRTASVKTRAIGIRSDAQKLHGAHVIQVAEEGGVVAAQDEADGAGCGEVLIHLEQVRGTDGAAVQQGAVGIVAFLRQQSARHEQGQRSNGMGDGMHGGQWCAGWEGSKAEVDVWRRYFSRMSALHAV
jgi:hypothetical protein